MFISQKNNHNENIRLQTWIGALFVAFSSISFSAKSVLAKLAYQEVNDAVIILTLRMGLALPFFLFVAITKKSEYTPTRKDWFQIFLMGFIGYYLASLFDFWGLEYIPAGMERLILFIYPTLVVVITFLVFGRKIEKKEIVALLLTYSGVLFVFINENIIANRALFTGSFLVFLSALCYAIYLIGSDRLIPKIGASKYTAYALSISASCIIIHFLIDRNWKEIVVSPRVFGLGLLTAIVSTVIPTFTLAQGIKRIGSSKSAIIGTIGPVSTIILAYFFLGEKIGITEFLGTTLIIMGVLFISNSKSNAKVLEETKEAI